MTSSRRLAREPNFDGKYGPNAKKLIGPSPRRGRLEGENYGQIILHRGVHPFNYESFQTRADVGRSHSCNVISVICENVLNRTSFLLSCHAAKYRTQVRASNTKTSSVTTIRRADAATTWFESLAVAQFTRRGGRPLQRRLAETDFLSADCDLDCNFSRAS